LLLMSNKRWRATFVSHFGQDIEAETLREAEAKALAWLQEEYGYDLARATEFEVEPTDE
jgi:hypothetical protein